MLKKIIGKATALVAIFLLVLATLVVPAKPVDAGYYGNADCDNNAIIRCGVGSETELRSKFRNSGFVRTVFGHFGMKNTSALSGMKKGKVTKSGNIYVNGKKVAHGAVTTGRKKMTAHDKKVPGAKAYMRPPSVSFRSNSLEALVKLNSRGEFMWGVIMSCGNPLQAHAIKKPAPEKPKPEKPKPEEPKPQKPKNPGLGIEKDVRAASDDEWEPNETEADPGETVEYRITVENTGETDLEDVHIQDSLPSGLDFDEDQVLQGSTEINDQTLGDLIGDGITISSLREGESLEIIFNVTVKDETDACEEPLNNIAFAKADDVPEKDDDADVTVCQPDEEPPAEEPEPQVQGEQTPPSGKLPSTGAAGAVGIFSATSFLGFAAYKLKEFFLTIMR